MIAKPDVYIRFYYTATTPNYLVLLHNIIFKFKKSHEINNIYKCDSILEPQFYTKVNNKYMFLLPTSISHDLVNWFYYITLISYTEILLRNLNFKKPLTTESQFYKIWFYYRIIIFTFNLYTQHQLVNKVMIYMVLL